MRAFGYGLILTLSVADSAHTQVRWILPFRENAAHGDRSISDEIVFERAGEIFLTKPQLLNERCLTCGIGGLRAGTKAGPVWHPSGEFMAFASGGIWFLNSRNGAAAQVYVAADPRRIRDLRFSRDGKRLAWFDGNAAFAAVVKGEQLLPAERLDFGRAIQGVDDFSADGRELIVTSEDAIASCAIRTQRCRDLVRQSGQRIDFARVSPNGNHLLFASTEGGWRAPKASDDLSDYWLLNFESGLSQRITWFNEVQNPHYLDRGARVTDSSWTRDGLWILTTVLEAKTKRPRLMMIQFPEAE